MYVYVYIYIYIYIVDSNKSSTQKQTHQHVDKTCVCRRPSGYSYYPNHEISSNNNIREMFNDNNNDNDNGINTIDMYY